MSAISSTPLLDLAVHHSPLISQRGLLERLFTFWFNSLVYNQIWEDPRVDLAALQLVPEESRIVTISSGGCNVLNYLSTVRQRSRPLISMARISRSCV